MGLLAGTGIFLFVIVLILAIINKEVLFIILSSAFIIIGILICIYTANNKRNFKKRCDEDIKKLSKNKTKNNLKSISQLKRLKELN